MAENQECPYQTLLRDWQRRPRMMGRDQASHPLTLRMVMEELDKQGRSEAGDCIQSLVFELHMAKNRNERLSEEINILTSAGADPCP